MITFIYRKSIPTFFSIEKLFDALYARLAVSNYSLRRLELPFVSKGASSVIRNLWFVARSGGSGILHITGDVHYAAMLRPFSRTIITVHDCVAMKRATGFKRFAMWVLWFGLPIRLASAVVVISEKTKKELMETVGVAAEKIQVISNFVDEAFSFSERAFSSDEPPRILHVGTTPNKNLSRVIAALRDIPCVLVIVGRIPSDVLKELNDSAILYESHAGIGNAAMVDLYLSADIVSFPSTYEGFGMPILEGQAVGRPVLTSDLEPLRSVAGPGGALLVDPFSVISIQQGFLKLVSDPVTRRSLIEAGRENSRRYTLQAVAALYAELYRKLGETPGQRAT